MNGFALTSSALIPGVPAGAWAIVGAGDYNGDGKADILWRNTSTGENAIWLMDGFALTSSAFIPTVADPNWTIVKQ